MDRSCIPAFIDGDVVRINLPNGRGSGLASLDDWEMLRHRRFNRSSHGYAYVIGRKNGKTQTFPLHRMIAVAMGLKIEGLLVDHINGDKLDNRRENLRAVTTSQNGQNVKRARRGSTTGVRGVHLTPSGTFEAKLKVDGKTYYLGKFQTIEQALAARLEGEAAHHTHRARRILADELARKDEP